MSECTQRAWEWEVLWPGTDDKKKRLRSLSPSPPPLFLTPPHSW